MSDLLIIGAGGARAYQRALATTSSNIGNAENPDYVRRSLQLGEFSINGNGNPIYSAQVKFGGVQSGAVARAHDPFLEANARLTGAALYGAETRSRFMADLESGLGNTDTGLGAKLNAAFASGEELAAAPFESILRSQFLSALDDTARTFNRTAVQLENTASQVFQSAQQEVRTVNEAIKSLAETNIALRKTAEGTPQQAALLDIRDTALAVITERMDVDISFEDKGAANISLDGEFLLNIGDAQELSVIQSGTGELSFLIEGNPAGSISTGSLAALMDSAQITAARQTSLDALANNFAADINDWNARGLTDNGDPGAALFNPMAGAKGITMLTKDPAMLALATAGGASNGNILALPALRGPGGSEQGWTNIVGAQAIVTASAQSDLAATSSQHEAARAARDNLSSVDLDREAADLIRFQQAYDASARVIQVARETMQSIFAIF